MLNLYRVEVPSACPYQVSHTILVCHIPSSTSRRTGFPKMGTHNGIWKNMSAFGLASLCVGGTWPNCLDHRSSRSEAVSGVNGRSMGSISADSRKNQSIWSCDPDSECRYGMIAVQKRPYLVYPVVFRREEVSKPVKVAFGVRPRVQEVQCQKMRGRASRGYRQRSSHAYKPHNHSPIRTFDFQNIVSDTMYIFGTLLDE